MTKPVRFNLEYDVFKHHEKAGHTVKNVIESYAFLDGFDVYLESIHSQHCSEPAYHDAVAFRNDIDRAYTSRSRIGEAFLDGAALALDSLAIFTPDLIETAHDELARTRTILEARWLGTDPSLDDDRAFVKGLMSVGAKHIAEYARDYQVVMDTISDTRGYSKPEQSLSIVHGFALVMDAAGRAYTTDLETFASEITDDSAEDHQTLISDITRAYKNFRRKQARDQLVK